MEPPPDVQILPRVLPPNAPTRSDLVARILRRESSVGVRRVEDLVAYQWATEFKLEVYRLCDASPAASRDLKYRDQLFGAASGIESNIAEGFGRFLPGEFSTFLRYAIASLAESVTRLRDGVHRRHFRGADIEHALTCAARCAQATRALHASQRRLIARKQRDRSTQRRDRP